MCRGIVRRKICNTNTACDEDVACSSPMGVERRKSTYRLILRPVLRILSRSPLLLYHILVCYSKHRRVRKHISTNTPPYFIIRCACEWTENPYVSVYVCNAHEVNPPSISSVFCSTLRRHSDAIAQSMGDRRAATQHAHVIWLHIYNTAHITTERTCLRAPHARIIGLLCTPRQVHP